MIKTFGYQELYSTIIGWFYYDSIATFIIKSGLILLIPISIIVISYYSTKTSTQYKSNVESSVNNVQMRMFTVVFVILFVFVPYVDLEVNSIEFELNNGDIANLETNDSTFHGEINLNEYQNVKVPIAWYVLMQITSGVNTYILKIFPNTTNIRENLSKLKYINITDRKIYNEVKRFENECFNKTLKYFDKQSTTKIDAFGTDLEVPDDEYWLGSEAMLRMYGNNASIVECATVDICPPLFRADKPVNGFAKQYRDVDAEYQAGETIGRPLCSDWWQNSLKDKLLTNIKNSKTYNDIEPSFLSTFFSGLNKDDLILRRVLSNTNRIDLVNPTMQYADSNRFSNGNVQAIAGTLGVKFTGTLESSKTYAMTRALPIIQGDVLMLFYFILPILLFFTGFSFGKIVFISIGFFSIRFLTVLWHLVYWLDEFYVGGIVKKGLEINAHRLIDVDGGSFDRGIHQYLLMFGYYVFPLIFLSFMGWIGYRALDYSEGTKMGSSVGNAGGKGQGLITKVVTKK